jgi:hypothetical protein
VSASINLLPRVRRSANARRRAIRLWTLWGTLWCAVLAAGQAIALSSGTHAEGLPLEREISLLATERTRLESELLTIEQAIERDSRSLAAARAIVDHPDWSVLLARVVAARSPSMAFSRWALERGAHESLVLRIEGTVPTLAALTDFALALESLGVFRRVHILRAQSEDAPAGTAQGAAGTTSRRTRFSIEGLLLAPESPRKSGEREVAR